MITMTYGIFFHPMLFSWQLTLSCLLVKRGVEQLQRSNLGHAQRDQFLPAACQFPAQNLKGSIRKLPLSREGCVKRLKFSSEICKRRKEYRKEEGHLCTGICWFTILFWTLPKKFHGFQTLACVVVYNFCKTTWFRQHESMPPCHNDVCTCAEVCARYGWKWPGNVIKSKNKGCKTANEILCSGGNQNITVLHGGVYNRKLWNVDFDTVPVSELNGFKFERAWTTQSVAVWEIANWLGSFNLKYPQCLWGTHVKQVCISVHVLYKSCF